MPRDETGASDLAARVENIQRSFLAADSKYPAFAVQLLSREPADTGATLGGEGCGRLHWEQLARFAAPTLVAAGVLEVVAGESPAAAFTRWFLDRIGTRYVVPVAVVTWGNGSQSTSTVGATGSDPGAFGLAAALLGDMVAQLASPPTKIAETANERAPAISHSPDFRCVNWQGVVYSFTTNQAAAVEKLWRALENGTPDVGGAELTTETQGTVKDLFRNNPAWGKLIVVGGSKGAYRLAEPKYTANTPVPHR